MAQSSYLGDYPCIPSRVRLSSTIDDNGPGDSTRLTPMKGDAFAIVNPRPEELSATRLR
jgi:hypothetical protein